MTWYPAPWGSDQGLMKLVTRTRRQGTVMTAAYSTTSAGMARTAKYLSRTPAT